ncbi:MAG: protein phosphatase [Cypionkella sp.]
MRLTIAELPLGCGTLGICPMPGRAGFYQADLEALRHWGPSLVITLTTADELTRVAPDLSADLARLGVRWLHLPVVDYGTPGTGWAEVSAAAHAEIIQGNKVLAHCMGGCGRSGMTLLRLMVETGEAADLALGRLRAVRPCAIETDAQFAWASGAGDVPPMARS